ncbi:MAG: AsmA family protein [Terriglobales bacterium]
MKFLRSKRGVAAVTALVLILFLFRPGVYRLRNRISTSIGSALGRKVTIDNVRFHVLPRPGFALEGLVIYDDPDFSAEPMIRAEDVFAAIRFRSLLRGRLEIATLSANEPSINLVRNNQGRWNLASLLERNAQIPAAPTAKTASESRPVFPYLEASNARVNFKLGQTKKSYALMNADVALWQDSDNSWSARIKAEPVRTDFHLTDTGLVQINARWQRASSMRLTPLEIAVQWQKGQLGQITQLLSGKDRGWRGGVSFAAKLSGTPEALRIESQATVGDFRRYDIVDTENMRLASSCSGQYDAVTGALSDLLCESPVGSGALRLRGYSRPFTQPPAYDLTLEAENVPLAAVVRLLRHAKQQLPRDLSASGLLNAVFNARQGGPPYFREFPPGRQYEEWTGKGSAINVILSSNAGKDEIALGTIPLMLPSQSTGPVTIITPKMLAIFKRTGYLEPPKDPKPSEIRLQIGPSALTINGSAPVNASGWISSAGYSFSLHGDAELKDLFSLERVLGLPVSRPAAEGSARLDVSVSGPWRGFAAPSTSGTAQLRNVRAEMRGLNTPIEIDSANISFTPDAVSLQKLSAHTGSTHWSGAVTAPRHCTMATAASSTVAETGAGHIPGVAPNCVFQFDLTSDQLSTGEIAEWFAQHPAKRAWYRILNSDSGSDSNSSSSSRSNEPLRRSPLLAIQAHGALHVGRFELNKLLATHVFTAVEVDRGKIALTSLRAQLLQGTHRGNWTLDVSPRDAAQNEADTPEAAPQSAALVHFHGSGALQDISLAQVGALMNDAWIVGKADGNFELDGSGNSFRELPARSEGKLHFAMRDGSLPHIEVPGSPVPLPVHRFTGELQLNKGAWELSAGRLESRDGLYQVGGTASPSGVFNFVMTRSDEQSWALTGTLAKPLVAPGVRIEAQTETNKTGAKP